LSVRFLHGAAENATRFAAIFHAKKQQVRLREQHKPLTRKPAPTLIKLQQNQKTEGLSKREIRRSEKEKGASARG
jgi:hypothetical protein